jgi:uncharacterized protein
MTPDEEAAEIARLKGLMLKTQFFVMQRQIVAPEKLKPVMLAHYHWIIGLEQQGHVFASGPLTPEGGGPGVGMTIFRCGSFEAARALAEGDPFAISGAATFTLSEWQVNEGRITITVDFSDGQATVV